MATLIVVEDLAGPSVRGRGGHALYVLQTVIGLQRLGHRVALLEYLDDDDPQAVSSFTDLTTRWLPAGERALLDSEARVLSGMTEGAFDDLVAAADAVVTLAAHYRREPWPRLEHVRPRILLEQDPGYTHLWALGGDPRDVFGEHDVYFTVGGNIGTNRCRLPTFGIDWHPYVNPIVLDLWSAADRRPGSRFGTVAGLRDYGWLEFEGRVLGPKIEQLASFADLPERIAEPVDIVSDLDDQDPDRLRLEASGWQFRDPSVVAEPEALRDFVFDSAGEFSVAKGGYVGTHCGWFSDRAACFLAAGRPVILQSTGFEDLLPTGCGLFAVDDVEQAVAAVHAVRSDPARHSAAARDIAREHLDANVVLKRMLTTAGVT